MMMTQMRMQEAYQKDKNTKMDQFEEQMKTVGESIDESWKQSGTLRARWRAEPACPRPSCSADGSSTLQATTCSTSSECRATS